VQPDEQRCANQFGVLHRGPDVPPERIESTTERKESSMSHRMCVAVLSSLVLPLMIATPGIALAAPAHLTSHPVTTRSAPAKLEDCGPPRDVNRGSFPNDPKVDNKFFRLVPGTKLTLRGTVGGGAHTVVTTVTDLTKVVDGVRTIVLFDVDLDGKTVKEAELAFFAQDGKGAVWALGEYPEEYDGGKFTGAPNTWISGIDGAKAGTAMRSDPNPGTPAYLQGLAPKINFKDCARV
jgi:hypothetical protein